MSRVPNLYSVVLGAAGARNVGNALALSAARPGRAAKLTGAAAGAGAAIVREPEKARAQDVFAGAAVLAQLLGNTGDVGFVGVFHAKLAGAALGSDQHLDPTIGVAIGLLLTRLSESLKPTIEVTAKIVGTATGWLSRPLVAVEALAVGERSIFDDGYTAVGPRHFHHGHATRIGRVFDFGATRATQQQERHAGDAQRN
jgi:hypothetical protein